MYSCSMSPKTKLDKGSVKWANVVGNADVSVYSYACIDAILALKYNLVDLNKIGYKLLLK